MQTILSNIFLSVSFFIHSECIPDMKLVCFSVDLCILIKKIILINII